MRRGVIANLVAAALIAIVFIVSDFVEKLLRLGIHIITEDKLPTINITPWLEHGFSVVLILTIVLLYIVIRGPKREEAELARFRDYEEFADRLIDNVGRIVDIQVPGFAYEHDSAIYEACSDRHDKISGRRTVRAVGGPFSIAVVRHWSGERLVSFPRPSMWADVGVAIDLPSRNLEHAKEFLVYLNPPVTDTRTFEYRLEWPNFWRALREKNRDFIEYFCARETLRTVIELVFPTDMGVVDWDPGNVNYPGVTTTRRDEGDRQRLVMQVENPRVGQRYKYNLLRRPS